MTIMPGAFQVENAAAAVAACEEFWDKEGAIGAKKGRSVDIEAVKRGINKAFLPGRLEVLSHGPMLVIDGAQNAASAEKLKYSVEHIFKYDRLILLLGFSRDKDIKGACGALMGLADEVIVTKSRQKRAADPEIIRGFIKDASAKITRDSREALGLAFRKAKKNDIILVAGSLYLAGEIRELALRKHKG
jgi:dihydrofolate synthase / folylpolyglutamate synthase